MTGAGWQHGVNHKAKWQIIKDGITFLLKGIPFKMNRRFRTREHHFKIELKLNNKKNAHKLLSKIVDEGLFQGLKAALRKIKDEFHEEHNSFTLKMTHRGIVNGVESKVFSFDQDFDDIVRSFQEVTIFCSNQRIH